MLHFLNFVFVVFFKNIHKIVKTSYQNARLENFNILTVGILFSIKCEKLLCILYTFNHTHYTIKQYIFILNLNNHLKKS